MMFSYLFKFYAVLTILNGKHAAGMDWESVMLQMKELYEDQRHRSRV